MKVHKRRDLCRDVVLDFHETTRLYRDNHISWSRRVGYFNNDATVRDHLINSPKRYPGEPLYAAVEAELTAAATIDLRQRKSEREYVDRPIELSKIGRLLAASLMSVGSDNVSGRRRPYASAGAVYGIEHYVVGLNVRDFSGVFTAFCSTEERSLIAIERGLSQEAARAALGLRDNPNLSPSFAIVQAIDLERVTRKYQERGYRFALLEAGMAAQNLVLYAQGLALSSLNWGGHSDDLLDRLLQLSPSDETSVNTILFGETCVE